jgi:hypothetical protein
MEHQCDPANSSQAQNGLRPDATTALRNADRLGLFVTSLPKWIAVAVIAWQAGISIEALSSRSALPSLLLARFGRQSSYWEVVCWVAGSLGILFGLYSRRVLRRQAALESARLDALERRLNPDMGISAFSSGRKA